MDGKQNLFVYWGEMNRRFSFIYGRMAGSDAVAIIIDHKNWTQHTETIERGRDWHECYREYAAWANRQAPMPELTPVEEAPWQICPFGLLA
jgi:hypothetical protein